jgi:hypothetical protein
MRRYGHGFALALGTLILAVWAATMGLVVTAAAPPMDGGTVVVLFLPGRAEASFAAIVRSGGRPVGASWAGLVWAVDTDPGGARRLRTEGAIAVLADLPFAAALGCGTSASVPQPVRASLPRRLTRLVPPPVDKETARGSPAAAGADRAAAVAAARATFRRRERC